MEGRAEEAEEMILYTNIVCHLLHHIINRALDLMYTPRSPLHM